MLARAAVGDAIGDKSRVVNTSGGAAGETELLSNFDIADLGGRDDLFTGKARAAG